MNVFVVPIEVPSDPLCSLSCSLNAGNIIMGNRLSISRNSEKSISPSLFTSNDWRALRKFLGKEGAALLIVLQGKHDKTRRSERRGEG